ncbi:hypothetical protein LIER_06756 [Lithospermum erythrorhizon]|uniref:Uncharacterized protein n=1 Tax=Lithospermum erythrorhizon TaxID=34254 RepID=A0AAV3PA06_LITER
MLISFIFIRLGSILNERLFIAAKPPATSLQIRRTPARCNRSQNDLILRRISSVQLRTQPRMEDGGTDSLPFFSGELLTDRGGDGSFIDLQLEGRMKAAAVQICSDGVFSDE